MFPTPSLPPTPSTAFAFQPMPLQAVGAELVVEFEGSTELGDTFMVRQSYLANELHWGYCFASIITRAPPGETQHLVDLSRWVMAPSCRGGKGASTVACNDRERATTACPSSLGHHQVKPSTWWIYQGG